MARFCLFKAALCAGLAALPAAAASAQAGPAIEVRVYRSDAAPAGEPEPQPRPSPGGWSQESWQKWLSPADLPPELTAVPVKTWTQLVLDVTPEGKATACRIVAASAEPRLDSLACALLPKRGRFEPVFLGPGRPLSTHVLLAVRWKVPAADEPPPPPPMRVAPPPTPDEKGWPRLYWAEHLRPVALPPIQGDFPPKAGLRDGMVGLDLLISAREGITGCTIRAGSGDPALDSAACAVASRLDLRYEDPCGVCLNRPLPLQVVWRRDGGSHIRLPLLSRSRLRHFPPMPKDPADPRTATDHDSYPHLVLDDVSPGELKRAGAFASPRGRFAVTLAVGADGQVLGCTVTASSGKADLDSRLCELLRRNRRYRPATDVFGDAAPSSAFSGVDLGPIR